jgi:hypothetical protein
MTTPRPLGVVLESSRILVVNQQPRPSSPHPKPLPTQTEDTQSGEPGAAGRPRSVEFMTVILNQPW